jgi:hypothetical protein
MSLSDERMIAQSPRDPWRAIWQVATNDALIRTALLGIAAGLLITAWLPQRPVANPVAYAEWLSKTQARFGDATTTMQTLGLFGITRSFVFRTLLALLGGILLLRLIEYGDQLRQTQSMQDPDDDWIVLLETRLSDVVDMLRRRRYRILGEPPLLQVDRWPWAELLALVTYAGGLLLLVGLLVTHVWGWQVESIIVESGERVTLSEGDAWVTWDTESGETTHSPGIVTYVETRVPGLLAQAHENTGRSLSLQQTPEDQPVADLTVAVAEDEYFAIPEAQLIVRLASRPDGPPENETEAYAPILIQVYRSPSGRLVTESQVTEQKELSIDGVTLTLNAVPYAQLTAVSNPGLWPTSIGILCVMVGVVGNNLWPRRRLWLREGEGRIESSGDSLPTLPARRAA